MSATTDPYNGSPNLSEHPAVPDRQLSSAVWQFGDTSGNQFVEEWQGVIRAEYQSKSWETQTTSSDPTLYHTMT